MTQSFDERFVEVFDRQFPSIFRYIDRLSGDPDLAADIAQDAFIRLYRRGALPESPSAWLVSVATNLLRNVRSKRSRRFRLMTPDHAERVMADPLPGAIHAMDARRGHAAARRALDRLSERDRQMLLLRAEGYSYREISAVLDVSEASIGTLLARAKSAFRQAYEESARAP